MATTGIKYPVFAPITEFVQDDKPTYGTGLILGKATKVDATLNYAEGSLYADNAMAEYDAKLTGGSITFGVDELTPTKRHALFGHFTSTAQGVTTLYACADDKVVDGGFGYYKTCRIDGVSKYSARWYYRVIFKESTESAETANESINFSGTEIVGTILPVYDADVGDAIYEETVFDTEAAAKAYLDDLANIPANAPIRSIRPSAVTDSDDTTTEPDNTTTEPDSTTTEPEKTDESPRIIGGNTNTRTEEPEEDPNNR